MTNIDYDRMIYTSAVEAKRQLFLDLMKFYEKWCIAERDATFEQDVAKLKETYKKSKCSQIIIDAIVDELMQGVC